MEKRQPANVVDLVNVRSACKDCTLRELCLPLGLSDSDIRALDAAVKRRRRMKKGEMLYRFGDPLRSVYAIRRGTFKSTGLMEDGRVQVTAFYLPGEMVGLDAINTDEHPCTAEALDTAEVCEIPFGDLEDLARKVPGLQHQLFKFMSREIVREERLLMMLGRMTAEERLAACLMSFWRRYTRLGGDKLEFKLSMSRQDLADYLGLALETVSRLFSRFQEDGLISVHGRHVRMLEVKRLDSMSGGQALEGQTRHA